jgi:glycosyltransferase involved in cell wall biosynthesis
MRVTHVIASLDPAHGGPPVVAEKLAAAQAALGHAAVVAAQDGPGAVPLPRHGFADLFRRPAPELLALAGSSDVLHLHGVWEPVLVGAAGAARALGIPYVVTPHGMLDPWSLAQKKWKKRLALALGYRRMLDGAAFLHVLNADERALMQPLGLRAPAEVIPNGISLDELNPPPDPALFRARWPSLSGRRYVLFLSRLHYKKGLDYLAEAFAQVAARFTDVDLVVAGPDAGEEAPFRQRVANLTLNHRVWLTGPLYGPEKWSALAGAACFCLPSRQEGFSVAILEAMACHVPVVVSEQCHFPEVGLAKAGRIVGLNAEAVAAGLSEILGNRSAAEGMGAAGRRLVESRFTWATVASHCNGLYEKYERGA